MSSINIYWANRIERLGLGPRPLPADLMSADVLTERLDDALVRSADPRRARSLGPAIASHNGVADAIDVIELLSDRFIW
jgi:sterol 3beta-glucosyltransferase